MRKLLPYLFLAPALTFVLAFFFIPVILTGVFSFTSMSTATGIFGGRYSISGSSVTQLRDQGFPEDVLVALDSIVYVANDATLPLASEAGASDALVTDIRNTLLDQTFSERRELEDALKQLPNRPRNTRELKAISATFETSIKGRDFATEDALLIGLRDLGLELNPQQEVAIVDVSYTGWRWTLENFRRIFRTPDQLTILINTFFYVFVTLVFFNTGFAIVLAITTFYLPARQAAFFRAIWLLPRITPSVIYVLLWKWLAWDVGFLNSILPSLGIDARNWMLDTPTNAWVFVILINGFIGASMGMIIFTSALRAIPKPMIYASEVDGAKFWQQVRYILLPQLKWPILFITCYQTLSLLTSFEQILLSTDGGPGSTTEVWALQAYHVALQSYSGNLQYGYGAALAMVLVVVGLGLSTLYLRAFNFNQLVQRPKIET
ncbi:MAG: ABC transporter permease subunit [Deinococcota bacterium]